MSVFVGISIFSPVNEAVSGSSSVRKPSSIVLTSTKSVKNSMPNKMLDWDLDCLPKQKQIKDAGRVHQVRILGKACDHKVKGQLKQATIINRTNGFEATGFLINKNQFTSDYIYLNPGKNNIIVSLETNAGNQHLGELNINREK